MGTILLTTIGINDYLATTYHLGERCADTTPYVAQALCQLLPIEHVILLVTAEARAKHWSTLQPLLPPGSQAKDIPSGETEAETWQIFDVLVESIPPQSDICFDITHSFRSIPMLVLLGAAFLRTAKQVTISGLYYGLYRHGQAQTPILDLTSALRLLDWLTATDQFITTGSSQQLGSLLETIQRDFYRQPTSAPAPRPQNLISFGKTIRNISRSLELIRPITLLEQDLPRLQHQSTDQLTAEIGTFAKPFSLLLTSIQNSYAPLALPSHQQDPQHQIQQHFRLIQWYIQKRYTVQAILLAREWIVSALCVQSGIPDYRERSCRETIERQLGSLCGHGDSPTEDQPIALHVSSVQELKVLWSQLVDYRNDIAHAQMRVSPLDGQALESFALERLLPALTSLFPDLLPS